VNELCAFKERACDIVRCIVYEKTAQVVSELQMKKRQHDKPNFQLGAIAVPANNLELVAEMALDRCHGAVHWVPCCVIDIIRST
jgi:hypothetical protein